MTKEPLHPLFDNFVQRATSIARENTPCVLAPMPSDISLEFLARLAGDGWISPVLINPDASLRARWEKLSKVGADLWASESSADAARMAQQLVGDGQVDILLWGGLSTEELAQAVGTRDGAVLSHASVVALPDRDRLLTITDGGWNILPTLDETVGIVRNSIALLGVIGVKEPRIAILSAVEDIDPRIPRTMEAASITQMARRGLFEPAVVDGPLRFDHAIALPAGYEPPFHSPVAGQADAVVAGSVEEANILIKALVHLGGGQFGGVLLGGKVPVAWPAWQGPGSSPLLSMALSILIWSAFQGN
jgi:phosphotransacetylase